MSKKNQRDFIAEIGTLLKKFPELLGKGLPQEVVDAAKDGMSLVEAYEQYMSTSERTHPSPEPSGTVPPTRRMTF